MLNISMIPRTKTLEVELSTKCPLSCSECPRVIQKPSIEKWNAGFLKTKPFLDNIDSFYKKINFCGAYGDAIYHPDLADIFSHIVNLGIKFRLETNGGYVSKERWKTLADALTYNSSRKELITFSIDGSKDNFTQYRTNGDWKGTSAGLEIFGEYGINTQWKLITFEYNTNYDTLKSIYDTALQYNVNEILLIHSARSRENEYVSMDSFLKAVDMLDNYTETVNTNYKKPIVKIGVEGYRKHLPETEVLKQHKLWEFKSDKPVVSKPIAKESTVNGVTEIVSSRGVIMRFHNNVKKQTITETPKIETKKNVEIWEDKLHPQCIKNSHHNFVGGDGKLLPCCWLRAAGPKRLSQTSDILGNKWEDLSIYNNKIEDIVKSNAWKILSDNLLSYETCHQKCPSKK